jgi:hypothetical protein
VTGLDYFIGEVNPSFAFRDNLRLSMKCSFAILVNFLSPGSLRFFFTAAIPYVHGRCMFFPGLNWLVKAFVFMFWFAFLHLCRAVNIFSGREQYRN